MYTQESDTLNQLGFRKITKILEHLQEVTITLFHEIKSKLNDVES